MSKIYIKVISFFLAILIVMNLLTLFDLNMPNEKVYADGIAYNGQIVSGTYTISTTEQLNILSSKVNSGITYQNSIFILLNDIDFGKQVIFEHGVLVQNFTCIGTKDNPFMGTFDGNNKLISNIVCKVPFDGTNVTDDLTREHTYTGFIGHLKDGVVKNVKITAFRQVEHLKQLRWHGILIGVNSNGVVDNCSVEDTDEHMYLDSYHNNGQLRHVDITPKSMVWINHGDIINCVNKYGIQVYVSWTDKHDGCLGGCAGIAVYNYGNIRNCSNVAEKITHGADKLAHGYGGIVFWNYGLVENCFNTAEIMGDKVAGIACVNEESGIIKDCYNKGGSLYNTSDGFLSAGITTYNSGVVEYCYNESNISGNMFVGGIVGEISGGRVSYCYNKGIISGVFAWWNVPGGNIIGGIVGEVYSDGVVEYCYNTGAVQGNSAGGVVGNMNAGGGLKNCYSTGEIYSSDPPKDKDSIYPFKDGYVCNGGVIGYNLYNINEKTCTSDVRRVVRHTDPEDRPDGRPGRPQKLEDYGLYIGKSEYNNISNTYYYQFDSTYNFSAHLLCYSEPFREGTRRGFPDIHGADKQYGKTLAQMQSQELVDLLNTGGKKIFVRDAGTTKLNNGFPIFKWQQLVTDIKIKGNTDIVKGGYEAFVLELAPEGIDGINFTWGVADDSVVKVVTINNGTGAVIYGLKLGFTTITVTSADKNKCSSSIIVRVVNKPAPVKDGYYLVGEEMIYTSQYYDEERDPKYYEEYMYKHNQNYFDNTLGQVNYNNTWLSSSIDRFSKVGAYEVYLKVQDNPPTANKLGFENYRYFSKPAKSVIYVHRKPIAYFSIKSNTVADSSYDLDHSVSRNDKGIMTWEWTYINSNGVILTCTVADKATGVNMVNNWISSNFQGVNYELLLRVQDIELVWSDVCINNENTVAPPVADFNIANDPLFFNKESQQITNTSYDLASLALISYWNVYKNNVNILSVTGDINGSINTVIKNNGTGEYSVTLKVVNSKGVESDIVSKTFTATVINTAPTVDFNLVSNESPTWVFPRIIGEKTFLQRPVSSFFVEEAVRFTGNRHDNDTDNLGFRYNWKFERYSVSNLSGIQGQPDEIFSYKQILPFESSFKNASLPWGAYRISFSVTDSPPVPPYKDTDKLTSTVTKTYYMVPEITLSSSIDTFKSEVEPGDVITLKARTNKFVTDVTADTMDGTVRLNRISEDSDYIYWNLDYTVPLNLTESKDYPIIFHAYTNYGGNGANTVEIKQAVNIKILVLKLYEFKVDNIVNHKGYSYPIAKASLPVGYKTGYNVDISILSKGNPSSVQGDIFIDSVKYGSTLQFYRDYSSSAQKWVTKFYTPADLKTGIITIKIRGYKNSTVYDYNQKENWNGHILTINGTAIDDGIINRSE